MKHNKQIIVNQYTKDYTKRSLRLYKEIKSELEKYQKVFRFYQKSVSQYSNQEILNEYKRIKERHEKLLEQLAKKLKINQLKKYMSE